MFSDDVLFHQLALKGGNAVNLVYKFGSRASVDIDLSIESDFDDIEDTRERILRALTNRFTEAKYTVDRWGGYEVSFKIIETARYDIYSAELDRARREATVVGPENQRTFRVQISKYEHCAGKREVELDRYAIYVYTPEMLAIEKFRAICQQMPDYAKRGHPTPRARDFYDIHTILASTGMRLNSSANLQLMADIFRAKDVDVKLIDKIAEQREFHRPDWPSVQLSVAGELKEFDFYFDLVLAQGKLLESLWIK